VVSARHFQQQGGDGQRHRIDDGVRRGEAREAFVEQGFQAAEHVVA